MLIVNTSINVTFKALLWHGVFYIHIYIYVKGEHGCRHDYSEGRKNSMKLSEVLLNS